MIARAAGRGRRPADLFVLKIKGDSMAGGGQILDGDLLVVRCQQAADDGGVIAALLEGEATVKRLKRKDGGGWFMPHNPAYDSIPGEHARGRPSSGNGELA